MPLENQVITDWEGFYQFHLPIEEFLEIPLRQGFSIQKKGEQLIFIWELNPKKVHSGLKVNNFQVVFSPNITIESYGEKYFKVLVNGIGGIYAKAEDQEAKSNS